MNNKGLRTMFLGFIIMVFGLGSSLVFGGGMSYYLIDFLFYELFWEIGIDLPDIFESIIGIGIAVTAVGSYLTAVAGLIISIMGFLKKEK